MMLNSMWGKFGQRLNKTQVQTFDDPQAFHQFLDTDTIRRTSRVRHERRHGGNPLPVPR